MLLNRVTLFNKLNNKYINISFNFNFIKYFHLKTKNVVIFLYIFNQYIKL